MNTSLTRIVKSLSDNLILTPSNYGLLSGTTGEILFLYYYSYVDKSYKEKADSLLESLIDSFNDEKYYYHTFCSGFSGFGIALHLLEEAGLIEDSADLLEDIDLYISYRLMQEISIGHYDFLHGAIGIGFYFLKHAKYRKEFSVTQLERIVNFLEVTGIVDEENNTVKWRVPELYKGIKNPAPHADFNISLSHGMSSIAIFLSRLIELNLLDNSGIETLLNRTVNYILAQRIDVSTYGCYFPSTSIESSNEITTSRLAWCYGDLGVAIALLRAGRVLNREEVIKLVEEILVFTSRRRDVRSNGVIDAGICHGAAGLAQIFFRMHKETGLEELKEAYDYWKDVTISYGYHEDGLAGYKHFRGPDDGWKNETGILEGIAGIGLSMLSEINSDWDEILLLSFK